MTKIGKINLFAISAIVIGILSFALVFSNLTSSYSATKEIVEDFSYELRDISDVIHSETTTVVKEPKIENNKINFQVIFRGKGDYFQFFFDILNASSRSGIVKDIKIFGLENEDMVKVSIIGIKKDDIIEGSRYIDNIKVIVECVDDNYDALGNITSILENISIDIEIE